MISEQRKVEDMSLKHRELILNDELVLPLKYKTLLELVTCLDQSLVFLKECRKSEYVLFSDVCESVKIMGRELTINTFRQILAISPDFYSHCWVNSKLAIDIACDLKLNNATLTRRETFKAKVLQRCTDAFKKYCSQN